MKRREPILLQGNSADFIVVDGMFQESCDDVTEYEYITTEEECKEAMQYLYENNTVVLRNNIDESGSDQNSRWAIFNNTSARPLGCYYYPAGKKVIHPANMCESGSCKPNQIPHDDVNGRVKRASESKLNRKQVCVRLGRAPAEIQDAAQPVEIQDAQPAEIQAVEIQDAQPAEIQDAQPVEIQDAQPVEIQDAQPAEIQDAQPAETTQQEIAIDTVAPTIVPFCQWNRGTIQGEKIVTDMNVYMCPEGTTIYCPDEYSIDDENITTSCIWEQSTDAPLTPPPEPKCQPNEARTVYIAKCQPADITTEKCKDNIPCQMDGKDCFCPEGSETLEVTCNATDKSIVNVPGRLDCGEYGTGYELTCPDGYLLNKTTQLCEKVAIQLQSL